MKHEIHANLPLQRRSFKNKMDMKWGKYIFLNLLVAKLKNKEVTSGRQNKTLRKKNYHCCCSVLNSKNKILTRYLYILCTTAKNFKELRQTLGCFLTQKQQRGSTDPRLKTCVRDRIALCREAKEEIGGDISLSLLKKVQLKCSNLTAFHSSNF